MCFKFRSMKVNLVKDKIIKAVLFNQENPQALTFITINYDTMLINKIKNAHVQKREWADAVLEWISLDIYVQCQAYPCWWNYVCLVTNLLVRNKFSNR